MERKIELGEKDRAALERLAKGWTHVALRAQIVLMAGEGLSDVRIARRLKVTRTRAARWIERYLEAGLAGIRPARNGAESATGSASERRRRS